ncbi:MAG: suppressor of fused domain protein [Chloroflexi bacterium]|nr:suppressor of fused domain protein [Chloroflexota bacterium]
MFAWLKKLFGKNTNPRFSSVQYEQHYELKKQGLEKILGQMHHLVGHAIIPFQVGGAVDMYYFPDAIDGTAFVTMELIEPDGSGPQPSTIGTYELIAFSRRKIIAECDQAAFQQIERRICSIFTSVGRYSYHAMLQPYETMEVPADEHHQRRCLMIDQYQVPGVDFTIGGHKHGLLLLIEVFQGEMEYAMANGSRLVLDKLREKGYYPYSDLDREPVF